MSTTPGWTPVCAYDRLESDRGVAALVDGVQVALFRTVDGLFAIDNRDPLSGAYVLSRGIVGSRDGVPTLASPLHKQVYDLRTGECLDRPGAAVPRHGVRCRDGLVEVRLHEPAAGEPATVEARSHGPTAVAWAGGSLGRHGG
jgi:nitrite reductase (NADH) small subunit